MLSCPVVKNEWQDMTNQDGQYSKTGSQLQIK